MTVSNSNGAQPSRWLLLAAFAAIYFVWGASYIGIRFAVETIPPFIMGGTRFGVAGLIMMAWALSHGVKRPTLANWRAATTAGLMMFLLNNGALLWAAQYVPSGVLSLLIAATPMWFVVLDWWRPTVHGRAAGGVRPANMVIGGLLLGFSGIMLLVNPTQWGAVSPNFAIGVAGVMVGTVAWAAGSLYARGAALPESPILCTGMQLLTGGVLLLIVAAVTGETAAFSLAQVAPRSAVAWVCLLVFGSIIGFGSYVWLLRVAESARVATYAYVNPIVAVFLGWALADEPLTPRTLLAAGIIIGSVMLINAARFRKHAPNVTLEPVTEGA